MIVLTSSNDAFDTEKTCSIYLSKPNANSYENISTRKKITLIYLCCVDFFFFSYLSFSCKNI